MSEELSPDLVLDGILAMATAAKTADTTRLRAWELLGRHLGLFRDASPSSEPPQIVRHTPSLNPDDQWYRHAE